jgi:hypothetical protein
MKLSSKSAKSITAHVTRQREICSEVDAGCIKKQAKPRNSYSATHIHFCFTISFGFRGAAVTRALRPLGVSWAARPESPGSCRTQDKMRGNTGNLQGTEPLLPKQKKLRCVAVAQPRTYVSHLDVSFRGRRTFPARINSQKKHYVF